MSSMAHYALGGSHHAWTQSNTMEHRLAWALCFSSSTDDLDLSTPEDYLEDLDDDSDDDVPSDHANDLICTSTDPICAPTNPICASTEPICASTTIASSDSEPGCYSELLSVPQATLRQTTLPFKPIPRDEWLAQEHRRYKEHLAERQDESAQFTQSQTQKKAKRREYERNRKRVKRARQREARTAAQAAEKTGADLQREVKLTLDSLGARQTISSLSRPHSATNAAIARQDSTKPSKRHVPLLPTRRINWCQDIYWNLIESAAQAVGFPWRPVDIVKRLRLIDPDTFQFLRPQRISQWRDHQYPNELRWTESHLRAIKTGSRPATGVGRHSIFHHRPDVVKMIKSCLLSLRKA
ncbi:hypothetical protein FS749_011943, partial [Ceratobasidium sp. UAMH 11750]